MSKHSSDPSSVRMKRCPAKHNTHMSSMQPCTLACSSLSSHAFLVSSPRNPAATVHDSGVCSAVCKQNDTGVLPPCCVHAVCTIVLITQLAHSIAMPTADAAAPAATALARRRRRHALHGRMMSGDQHALHGTLTKLAAGCQNLPPAAQVCCQLTALGCKPIRTTAGMHSVTHQQ